MGGILGKRKRAVRTLGKKLEIVHSLEKGASQRVVCKKFAVAKSTVTDIWKDRQKISDAVSASESPTFANKKHCIIRHAKIDLVDKTCWKWFCQQRSRSVPVSGVLLQEKE